MAAGGVAAACLTLLSLWRWQDGEIGWAVALLLLALVQLALVARRTSRRRPGGSTAAAVPTPAETEHARRHQPGWRAIGLVAMVAAVGTVVVFPPLALVLAGVGVYAMFRARGYGRLLVEAA
ncbi:hypothetical protein ACHAAC_00625 [Aeromicrobium sp. CF4.19]|uniref:hypothetical protein n=1 Tax=Aeromicrobium sp. CF4.19 TaxID=3373082 RepID=UPI003EE57E83